MIVDKFETFHFNLSQWLMNEAHTIKKDRTIKPPGDKDKMCKKKANHPYLAIDPFLLTWTLLDLEQILRWHSGEKNLVEKDGLKEGTKLSYFRVNRFKLRFELNHSLFQHLSLVFFNIALILNLIDTDFVLVFLQLFWSFQGIKAKSQVSKLLFGEIDLGLSTFNLVYEPRCRFFVYCKG